MLYDYNNGEWELLMKVETEKESNQSLEMVDNLLTQGRDGIYISVVKVGNEKGYFVVFDTNQGFYPRAFWGSLYPCEQAMLDVSQYCRKLANKMGWREK